VVRGRGGELVVRAEGRAAPRADRAPIAGSPSTTARAAASAGSRCAPSSAWAAACCTTTAAAGLDVHHRAVLAVLQLVSAAAEAPVRERETLTQR
jgi:hypothetical protein